LKRSRLQSIVPAINARNPSRKASLGLESWLMATAIPQALGIIRTVSLNSFGLSWEFMEQKGTLG